MKRIISILLTAVCLFSLSAFAFTLPEGMEQDLDDMGVLAADTIQNGCKGLPITWFLEEVEGTPDSIVYEVYLDGVRVHTSEPVSELSFIYTPEKGGTYAVNAILSYGESEVIIASDEIEAASKLYLGLFEQDRNESALEPIEWRVLDVKDGKALILSEYALRPGAYFNPDWIKFKYTWWERSYIGDVGKNNKPGKGDTPVYYFEPDHILLDDGSYGSEADLYYTHARFWLNGEFYETAFTDEERARIALTLNENKDNPDSKIDGGPDTEDYVFFLSYDEFNAYFKTREDARCQPTPACKAAHKQMNENYNCYWWLRSPGEYRCNAMYIHPNGKLSTYGSDVGHDSLGYRPAMWITIGG
ncbi:MAG: DUF6273 domain-containing protein [Eubacteriales bacterium]|nr:DUF6273 domain-containing protein [Eubacteriales bacterium]